MGLTSREGQRAGQSGGGTQDGGDWAGRRPGVSILVSRYCASLCISFRHCNAVSRIFEIFSMSEISGWMYGLR